MHFSLADKLSAHHLTRQVTTLFVILAIILFTILPIYQSLRQPRIGDADNLRIGLLLLNRYALESFPRDAAMQAGVWWPGYTPMYLLALGLAYQVIPDIGVIFALITFFVYIILMIGFYCFGRQLGFSVLLSLLLAYLSGLYQVTGHGLGWAGVGNEMATPRNIYLALLPWLLILALWLYRNHADSSLLWASFGLLLGFSTFVHPVSAGFLLSVFGLMMWIASLFGRFRWRVLLVFMISTLPGSTSGFASVSETFDSNIDPVVKATTSFIFQSTARLNVFFYRIDSWFLPLVGFGILTLVFVSLSWWAYHKKNTLEKIWLGFGIIQIGVLLFTLLVDWWTLFVIIEWAKRVRTGRHSTQENLVLSFLAAVNVSCLLLSSLASLLGMTVNSFTLASIARLFQRGQAMGYAGLILLSCFILRDNLRRYSAPWLYLAVCIATVVTGLHQAEFETIAGSWLPIDFSIYIGVTLLVLWTRLSGSSISRYSRNFASVIVIIQAVSRIFGLPAPLHFTLLISGLVASANELYHHQAVRKSLRPIVVVGTLTVVIAIVGLPITGSSLLFDLLERSRYLMLRDWSRQDNQTFFSKFYVIGSWIRENTPSDSLILTNMTELRYWSFRSQTVSEDDPHFLMTYPNIYPVFKEKSLQVNQAFTSVPALLVYACKVRAGYVIVSRDHNNLTTNLSHSRIEFSDGAYTLYRLNFSNTRSLTEMPMPPNCDWTDPEVMDIYNAR